MKHVALVLLASAVVVGPAPAQAPTSGTRMGRDAGDAMSGPVGMISASTAGAMNASTFVDNAARSDMYEISAARLAERQSKDPQIQRFAHEMVRDHTKTTQTLKAYLPAGISAPAELDERRQGMLDDLQRSSGSEFDKRYVDQQLAAHKEALSLMKGYAAHGDNAALRAVASKAEPIVAHHLQMAQALAQSR